MAAERWTIACLSAAPLAATKRPTTSCCRRRRVLRRRETFGEHLVLLRSRVPDLVSGTAHPGSELPREMEAAWVLWLLLSLSVASLAIMLERALFFRVRLVDVTPLLSYGGALRGGSSGIGRRSSEYVRPRGGAGSLLAPW
jgi:hypothetical protein